MRNSSGRSIAMVSATGAPVAGMTKLTVTVATGSPADNRSVRAAEGGGRPISICTAPGRGPSVPAERQGSGNDSGDGTPAQFLRAGRDLLLAGLASGIIPSSAATRSGR